MFIRCPECDYRVPEFESRDGLCLTHWEQKRQEESEHNEYLTDNDHLDAEAAVGMTHGPWHQARDRVFQQRKEEGLQG